MLLSFRGSIPSTICRRNREPWPRSSPGEHPTQYTGVIHEGAPSSAGLGANDQNLLQKAPFHNAFINRRERSAGVFITKRASVSCFSSSDSSARTPLETMAVTPPFRPCSGFSGCSLEIGPPFHSVLAKLVIVGQILKFGYILDKAIASEKTPPQAGTRPRLPQMLYTGNS